jgi:hypothetical protein
LLGNSARITRSYWYVWQREAVSPNIFLVHTPQPSADGLQSHTSLLDVEAARIKDHLAIAPVKIELLENTVASK